MTSDNKPKEGKLKRLSEVFGKIKDKSVARPKDTVIVVLASLLLLAVAIIYVKSYKDGRTKTVSRYTVVDVAPSPIIVTDIKKMAKLKSAYYYNEVLKWDTKLMREELTPYLEAQDEVEKIKNDISKVEVEKSDLMLRSSSGISNKEAREIRREIKAKEETLEDLNKKLSKAEVNLLEMETNRGKVKEGRNQSNRTIYDEICFIVSKHISAGFDLTKLTWELPNIYSKDTIIVTIPEPEIFDEPISEDEIRMVVDEGMWNSPTFNRLLKEAHQDLLENAKNNDLLVKAQKNGEQQIERLYKALGFQTVLIRRQVSLPKVD